MITRNFIKVSWMLVWRVAAFQFLFMGNQLHSPLLYVILLGIAAILTYGMKRTILFFPIARMFVLHWPIVKIYGASYSGKKYTPPLRSNGLPTRKYQSASVIEKASRNGKMTGYEPRLLKKIGVPTSAYMSGRPGYGLNEATHFDDKALQLGVEGEENFAKALKLSNQLDRFSTLWSVAVPEKNFFSPSRYGTDIDCVIATGNVLYLVDLKNYKSGDVNYTSDAEYLYCLDTATSNLVGQPKKMSKNMEMATEAMRAHFPNVNIVPIVVFMPTDKGEGTIQNVTWPGNIPAVNLTDFIQMLERDVSPQISSPSYQAVYKLSGLVKA